MTRFVLVLLLVVCGSLVVARRVYADDASDTAEARAAKLFEEGRALARVGRCTEAIPILLESAKTSASIGAFLNLGRCYEQVGKTLTAHRYYKRAGELASLRNDERQTEAHDRASAIERTLSVLTVRVSDPAEPGLVLRLDDEPLARERWGAPIPIDPGQHVLEAASPRRGSTTLRVSVQAEAEHAELVVPPIPPAGNANRDPRNGDNPTSAAGPLGTQRVLGYAIGGVGAGSVLVGAIFAMLSLVDHNELVDRCPTYPTCDLSLRPGLDDLVDSARTKGSVATISIIAGAVLLAGGAALVFTAPPKESHAQMRTSAAAKR